MTILALILIVLVGIILGAIGGGGSILMVPVLVYVMGMDAREAIAMSLPIVAMMALAGGVRHWRAGTVDLGSAIPFGLALMLGSFGGAQLAREVSGTFQLLLLASLMLVTATHLFQPPRQKLPDEDHEPRHPVVMLPIGVAVGVITGLVGISGGIIIVPTLTVLGRVTMRRAVGTSMLVIAMGAISGTIGYLVHTDVPWRLLLPCGAAAIAGVGVGSTVLRRVSDLALRRGFAVFLLLISAFIFWSNRHI